MTDKDITPIEKHGNVWFKRDDYFNIEGMFGAKVRACYILGKMAQERGFDTLTTFCAKSSPQINILASVGKHLGMKVVGHTTSAPLEPDMLSAIEKGAEIIQHKIGYTNVLNKRTNEYAQENRAFVIPYGMESEESISSAKKQFMGIDPDILKQVKRIVVPVGSGINVTGILLGLDELNLPLKVIGVKIGADPKKMFAKYIPERALKRLELVDALQPYNKPAEYTVINGVHVDSYYEGKCLPFIQDGDLFWIVGKKEHYIQGKELKI